MEPMNWRDLTVTEGDGTTCGNLGEMLDAAENGAIMQASVSGGGGPDWAQYFVVADDEEPDWDTPRRAVDWSGFAAALADAQRRYTESD